MIIRILLSLIIFTMSVSTACGQVRGDERALALIRGAEERMGSARGLIVEITGGIRDTRPGGMPETAFTAQVRLMKPNFAHIEFSSTNKPANAEPITSRITLASDGRSIWKLAVEKNRYTKRDARADGSNISSAASGMSVAATYMFFASRIPHSESPAIYNGVEIWNGKACEVVEFREPDPADAAHPVVRQRLYFSGADLVRYINEQVGGQYVEDWSLRNITIDPPLSAAEFAYAPPASAIDATPVPPAMMASGTPAPDFTLQDQFGQPVTLSSFRGKVVVLDFWSTSCGPCLESREHLNAVGKIFSDDVVLLTVHVWDPKAAFDAWLPRHPELDRLLFAIDPSPVGKDVASTLYNVPGLPSLYIVGKDGKIAGSALGFGGATDELELAIKKAGGTPRAAKVDK